MGGNNRHQWQPLPDYPSSGILMVTRLRGQDNVVDHGYTLETLRPPARL
ncbi:hypothetical protein [Legionella erythra]|nr:hypothetical protein [Legionella erythra]